MRTQILVITSCLFALALLLGCRTNGSATDETLSPEAAFTQKAEGLLDQWQGQTELLVQAAEQLRLAFKTNPNYAKAYVQVARLHIMGGLFDSSYTEPNALLRAEKAIRKAIEIEPRLAEAYVLLGHLYTLMDRFPEAKDALRTAEEIGTTSPWLAMNWAILFEKEGKADEAAAKYQQVIDSKTTNRKALGAAYDQLRSYYVSKRELDKAEATYQAQLVVDPTGPWTRGNYASSMLYDVGDFDRAIQLAREALSIMEYGNARHTLALALYGKWATLVVKHGDRSGAQPYFDEAHRMYPNLSRVRMEAMQYRSTRIIADALATVPR